ncbi:tetratricopeptide repeat protein [Lacinutrix jangbogonensis]|uniref:tetratricopeptide repeat protein n=1 Tax=Lacinutrix jangbogonensis TaxID=1469557 RepID=UPI00053D6EF4|nr:tetratricopeptide repeat protein [Lacinutrix jangbogonensis]
MKTNITLLIAFLFLGLNSSFAQGNEDCMTNMSLFAETVKGKKCEEALPYYRKALKDCPKYNLSGLYKYGEDMFKCLLKAATTDAKKVEYINELITLWDSRMGNYPSKSPKGKFGAKKTELRYDNRVLLGLTDQQIYNEYDAIYKSDLKNFKSPKGLYVYFKMMVSQYDQGQKTPQQLFNKFDDVNDKIGIEVEKNSMKLNQLIAKGESLSSKEEKYKKFYTQTLTAFDKISKSLDGELGPRANCEVLIPIYQRDYEENKNDGVWLQRAMNKLYAKGCKTDPMFVKVVKQKYSLEPTADVARYLYGITGEQKYLDEIFRLETDPLKLAKLNYNIGLEYKSKGSYGQARNYFNKAAQLNAADTKPYLQIAAMYAASVKTCGKTNFEKRAMYWLAARESAKSSSSIAAKYKALAPSKTDIFSAGMSGKTIKIGCWIGRNITVPTI